MKTLTIYENKKSGNLTCEKEWSNVIEHKFTTIKSVLEFINTRCYKSQYSQKVFVFAFYRKSWNSTFEITKKEVKGLFTKYTN